jgi:hypothetical protein
MGANFLVGVVLAGASATSIVLPPGEQGDLGLSLSLSSNEGSPALAVTMTNRSSADVCIRTELLKNPYTYEMHIRLRDRSQRTIKFKRAGFLPEPNVEPIRIAPGTSVQGRYDLTSRFKLPGGGKRPLKGLSARAAVRYDPCDLSLSQQAVSAWQPI